MLSVLIPVYNYSAYDLVKSITAQCRAEKIDFEVIVHDDASTDDCKEKNRLISTLEEVVYVEQEQNLGRARIRNRLADQAKHSFLLFLDCDSSLPDNFFIQRYLEYAKPGMVVCGGTGYRPKPPQNPDHYFRWYYGISREMKSAKARGGNNGFAISTNNLFIDKDVFNRVRFDESLTKYGHEDTLFGLMLKEKGFTITHIDNPLIHEGLESAQVFLEKTEQGVQNLKMLLTKNPKYVGLNEEVKLVKGYNLLVKLGLAKIFAFKFKLVKGLMEKNLRSKNPSLRVFDFYKLGILCSL